MDANDFMRSVQPTVLGNKNFNKLFCIGANKTGTTTLEYILRVYGYHLPDQQEQEIRLARPSLACDYSELVNFVSRFDAFQDTPFSRGEIYAVVDALFPNSKFILSERDAGEWFASLLRFHTKQFGLESIDQLTEEDILTKFNYLYPGYLHDNMKYELTEFDGDLPRTRWDLLYDRDTYIERYLGRNRRIKRYFQNCLDRLLIIDISRETTTQKICRFLNIPEKFIIDMPHLNRS